jgi:hypothetical protein
MGRKRTIRGVADEVSQRLEISSRARDQGLNSTAVTMLKNAVGVDERQRRLTRYTMWTQEDLKEFNEALAAQRTTDDPLWR